jgi:hypothetical protein
MNFTFTGINSRESKTGRVPCAAEDGLEYGQGLVLRRRHAFFGLGVALCRLACVRGDPEGRQQGRSRPARGRWLLHKGSFIPHFAS